MGGRSYAFLMFDYTQDLPDHKIIEGLRELMPDIQFGARGMYPEIMLQRAGNGARFTDVEVTVTYRLSDAEMDELEAKAKR